MKISSTLLKMLNILFTNLETCPRYINKQLGHFLVKIKMNSSHFRHDRDSGKVESQHANICGWGRHEEG